MAPIAGLVFPWGCEGTRERTVTTGQVGCAWLCSPTAQRWAAVSEVPRSGSYPP